MLLRLAPRRLDPRPPFFSRFTFHADSLLGVVVLGGRCVAGRGFVMGVSQRPVAWPLSSLLQFFLALTQQAANVLPSSTKRLSKLIPSSTRFRTHLMHHGDRFNLIGTR